MEVRKEDKKGGREESKEGSQSRRRYGFSRESETESLKQRVMEKVRETLSEAAHLNKIRLPTGSRLGGPPSFTSQAPTINGKVCHLAIHVTSESLGTKHQRPVYRTPLTVCTRGKEC